LVSWREAFKGALTTLVWSIAWIMAGLGVIVGAGLFGGLKLVEGPLGAKVPQPRPEVMIPAAAVGIFIIAVGWMATFYKILSETVMEGGQGLPDARTQPALICPLCGAENQPGAKFCRNCGAAMK